MHLWLCDSANPKHGQWTKRFGGFLIKHLGFFFQKHWTIEHWHICVCAFCSSFRSFTSVCLLSLLMSRQKPTACSALLIKFTSGSLTGKTESELLALRVFLKLLCVFLEIVHYKVILVSCNGMVCFSIVSHTFLCVRIYPGHHITRNDI